MSKKKRTPFAVLANFLPYLWPKDDMAIRRRVVIAVFLLVAEKGITIIIPLIYGEIVDVAATEDFVITLIFSLIGAYAATRLLQQIAGEFKYYVFSRVAQKGIRTLALSTFRHLFRLSLSFHLDRQTGGLSRTIERGVKSIEFMLTFILFNIIPTLVEIILVIGIFGWLFGWQLSLFAMLTIVFYTTFTIFVTEWRIKFRRRMNEYDKVANTQAIDSLLNYETVKYFNAEKHEAERYDRSLRRYEDAAVKNRTSLSFLNIGQGAIISIGIAVIMMLISVGVSNGEYSIGLLAAANMYLLQLYLPLNFLGTVYREIRQALIDMEEMFALMEVPPDINDNPNAKTLQVQQSTIEFDHISFGYGRGDILKEISFTVNSGEKTALVGASGSGKSTIARLLYRFYDPQQGAILIDGKNIQNCTQDSVRAAIAVVPQDTVLFNDTLRYNILYGNPSASEDELIAAVRLANLEDFILSLPDSYETIVGERGLKLSGGEKQRVSIARGVLKKSSIYVFDEATSSLDSRTESKIQRALEKIAKAHTTVVIAHRLSTIIDAHQILVLEHGRIVERGTHSQLLAKKGIYTAMWERQQQQDFTDFMPHEMQAEKMG